MTIDPYHRNDARWRRRMAARQLLETVLLVFVVFLLLRSIVQNVQIDGNSMEPTLHHEQYLVVNKLTYFHLDLNAPRRLISGEQTPPRVVYPFKMPRRGDTVVFHAPTENQDYIKRVIGLPGEHVAIREGGVFINGERLHEPYLQDTTACRGLQKNCDLVVPQGTLYVLGDNRDRSSDSRAWGPLPLKRVIGKAWISYWPQDYWSVINTPLYAVDR